MAHAGVKSRTTYTAAEAAERLGVPRHKIRGMIDGGRLRALWLAGAARITREEVEHLERKLTVRPQHLEIAIRKERWERCRCS